MGRRAREDWGEEERVVVEIYKTGEKTRAASKEAMRRRRA